MDANGTRFHLLLGEADWSSCTTFVAGWTGQTPPTLRALWQTSPASSIEPNAVWDAERGDLTLRPLILRFKQNKSSVTLTPEDRRGAAADEFGNWYWLDSTRNKIQVFSSGSEQVSDFWYPGIGEVCVVHDGTFTAKTTPTPIPLLMGGLAVTVDHYLVVGVLKGDQNAAGVLIFDLHSNGEPELLVWPDDVAFEPFDMAASPCGGVWILDRTHRRYWKLDRHFNVIRHVNQQENAPPAPALFQPVMPPSEQPQHLDPVGFPQGIRLDAAGTIPGDPVAIEALPDDSMLILDRVGDGRFSDVLHYHFGDLEPIKIYSTQEMQDHVEGLTSLVGHDFAFVAYDDSERRSDPEADPKVDRLYIVTDDGNQSFAFHFYHPKNSDGTFDTTTIRFMPLAIYLPMQLFIGKALVTAGKRAYYDVEGRWLPLVEQRRPRYRPEAILETSILPFDQAVTGNLRPALDGREPDCVWHRLMLDACIPPDAGIEVWSRAANDIEALTNADWMKEPSPYRRGDGSEQPFTRTGYDTYELLLQRAVGRYVQIRLRLYGNGRVSPRLRAMRAYYPRYSYLTNYLPAVFRQDKSSASFVDRFLANIEGFFTTLEDKIAVAQLLIDTRSAPAEILDWLASWFGVVMHPAWDDARRRLFIRYAMRFFQARGTVHGLQWALRLALDECVDAEMFEQLDGSDGSRIRIIEKFRTRQLPGVLIGDPTDTGAVVSTSTATAWQPVDGINALNQRYYTAFIDSLDGLAPNDREQAIREHGDAFLAYPIRDPGGIHSALWQSFSAATLGFIPSGISQARQIRAWQEFLERRYQTIDNLNTVYSPDSKTFDVITPPTELPAGGEPLVNWYQFERFIVPSLRTAHQFTVLLPTPTGEERLAVDDIQDRLELAVQVLDLEKPAHTVYEMKYYWAMFRLGETRLGVDTLVDVGSRAPELMTPAVLGRSYLSESYLAPRHPYNVLTRRIVGRDRIVGTPGEQSL